MNSFENGRMLLGRLSQGGDLLKELTAVVQEHKIETGIFMAIGAVAKARFGFFDQEAKEYLYVEKDEHLEIVSCTGNISILDGQPFVHAHIVLADREGKTYGGHLAEGTEIFACELYVKELKGNKLTRSFNQETGLSLW